jgi:hypothetical protein
VNGDGRFGRFVGAIVAGILIGALVLSVLLHNSTEGFPARLASWITGRPLVIVTAPDVVEKIQRLNRLETVVYSLDTVVESHESSPIFPDALAGDRLLMIVHGQTVAGLDLGKLKPESVQISEGRGGRSIRLTLPPSEVFLTTVDNAKTRVYERQTGLFVRADPNLESATRLRAQGELQEAALTDGILDTASKNGRETVRAMLQGLGFTQVQIQ